MAETPWDSRVDPLTALEIDEAFEIVCLPTLQGRTVEYIQNYGKDPATVREVVLARALPAAGVSEDTARLDWIESHGAAVQGPTELNPGLWCVLIEPPNRRVRAVCEERSTLRETIDAARAARRPADEARGR